MILIDRLSGWSTLLNMKDLVATKCDDAVSLMQKGRFEDFIKKENTQVTRGKILPQLTGRSRSVVMGACLGNVYVILTK